MMRVVVFAVVLVFGAVGAAEEKPEPLSKEAQQKLDKLQGKWILKEAQRSGVKFEVSDGKSILEIKGTKWIFTGQVKGEFIAIFPDSDPKCFDLKSAEEGRKGAVAEGIYKLEGETLTFCLNEGKEKQRPANFDTKDAPATTIVTVFQRIKEE